MRILNREQLCCVKHAQRKGITDKYEAAHYLIVLDQSINLESHENLTWFDWTINDIAEAIQTYFNNNHEQQKQATS